MKRFIVLFTIIFYFTSFAQNQRAITKKLLDKNNITVTAYNYGSFCSPNYQVNISDFVWNGLGYMREFGPIIGGEVIGAKGDTLHICSDSFIQSSMGDYDPIRTTKWGWLPLQDSSDFVTTSRYDSTGVWHTSYKMCDFSNSEFEYYPSETDSSMRGLGIIAKVTIYQPKGFAADAIVVKYDLTNAGTKPLNKLYFGFYGDPYIGGSSDYSDDRLWIYYQSKNLTYKDAVNSILVWDEDRKGVGGAIPGYLGLKIVGNGSSDELSYFAPTVYGSPHLPKNDELMWQWMRNGIDINAEVLKLGADNVFGFGTGSFSLKPGETKTFRLAISCAPDQPAILKNLHLLNHSANWFDFNGRPGATGGNKNYSVSLNAPAQKISGVADLSWKFTGASSNAKVSIEYSSDCGESWNPVKSQMALTDTCYWNTSSIPDGQYYLLRIIAYNPENLSENYYSVTKNYITIDKPAENAVPELFLLSDLDNGAINSNTEISYIIGDADTKSMTVIGGYGFTESGPFTTLFSNEAVTGTYSYILDPSKISCAEKAYFKLSVFDGNSLTSRLIGPFSTCSVTDSVRLYPLVHKSGMATPDINIEITDKSLLNGHDYEISFSVPSGDSKLATVRDINTNKTVVENHPVQENFSTPVFDGIRLMISDVAVDADRKKTSFNRKEMNKYFTIPDYPSLLPSKYKKSEKNWMIVFSDLDTLADGSWKSPLDTTAVNGNFICPFKIYEVNSGSVSQADFIVYESNPSTKKNSRWDLKESIILLPNKSYTGDVSYQLNFNFDNINKPHAGDTLYIYTKHPITASDIFTFRASDGYTKVEDYTVVKEYELSQNFPNPFNPATSIRFALPKSGRVNLTVFNILGETIANLADMEMRQGVHTISWNAGNLASGIYIYRLQSVPSDGSKPFMMSRKMLLLK